MSHTRTKRPPLDEGVHFRAPAGFLDSVHQAAAANGMTASSFMRNAIIHKINQTLPAPSSVHVQYGDE